MTAFGVVCWIVIAEPDAPIVADPEATEPPVGSTCPATAGVVKASAEARAVEASSRLVSVLRRGSRMAAQNLTEKDRLPRQPSRSPGTSET